MSIRFQLAVLALVSCLLFPLAGCASRATPVRHLASDVCLVTKGLSQKQVLEMLGPPDHRTTANGQETWVYYQARESLLRKTPYLGERLGDERFQVATITFVGGEVRACIYRDLSEEAFKKLGIPIHEPEAE